MEGYYVCICFKRASGTVTLVSDSFQVEVVGAAASSEANPEEIDIDNPEDIELEDESDDGLCALDESPPDVLEPSTSQKQQESAGPAEQEASMFASVEIHSSDT